LKIERKEQKSRINTVKHSSPAPQPLRNKDKELTFILSFYCHQVIHTKRKKKAS
jgi:hypothetical protein